MKHCRSIILGFFFLVGALMMGLSFNAYAQTSDIIQLDDLNHFGQISIKNIHVSEKEYYKEIYMDVHVQANDLALEDGFGINAQSFTIMNQNGKSYGTSSDCNMPTWDVPILGKKGGFGDFSICFEVEKEFNDFKIYYKYHSLNYFDRSAVQIGNISLNEKNDPTSSPLTSTPSSSPSITNFFEQLMNYLKQLFHFMILGSSFLNDS